MPSRQSAARESAAVVDTPRDPSVSFAPLDRAIERDPRVGPEVEPPRPDRASDSRSRPRRPRLIVESGRPAIVAASLASTGGHLGLSEYPVQISKVQAPPLREETLARDRLLEWLSVKIHRRAVLLIAEAGYGKTTLLADFTRRTRIRTLWFRLDRGDRDWVGFLAYLVAAVRIHLPDFGQATSALLRDIATAAPPLETVLDAFLRELSALSNEPTAVVFDDFHLVDDSPDVRHILRELLTRGPERMSFVFASRREPPVRLARLRALGEVAELGTNDLRFDAVETERLFSETYEMHLEPAVLAELSRRTEGWAASLQLVRAALHDRNPGQVRAFISSLSGAEGHLYEYLAEEVVGDLPVDLQQFLMRTSVLDTIDLTLGPVAAEVSLAEARGFIDDGERHGLFGKGGPHTRHVVRAHPLVRDFLQDRLGRSMGEAGVREIHLRVALAAEAVDWRVAARHYLAADHEADARRVLTAAIETILATGAYAAAAEFNADLAGGIGGVAGLVLSSRMALQRAAAAESLALAEEAWAAEPDSRAALLTVMSARSLAGDVVGAMEAGGLLEQSSEPLMAMLGRVYRLTMETSVSGSVDAAIRELEGLVAASRPRGNIHYLGVALSNLAYVRYAQGDASAALASATEAVGVLSTTPNTLELASARLGRSQAMALLGDIEGARIEAALAHETSPPGQAMELAVDIGQIEVLFGEAGLAKPLMERVASQISPDSDHGEQSILVRVAVHTREWDLVSARSELAHLRHGVPRSTPAFEARRFLTEGLVLALDGDPRALEVIGEGTRLAIAQGARLWARYGSTLAALADRGANPSSAVLAMAREDPVVLSMLAEVVLLRVTELDGAAAADVAVEAQRMPWRWRGSVRRFLHSKDSDQRQAAASLLELIGEPSDVQRLRDASRVAGIRRGARLGFQLARRLARRVLVEDLGRVRILTGDSAIEGGEVRRKVLALLCLLLSKGRFSSTREEVVDSLWPELEPSSALNSLNQTVYFLRRVFEPEYLEDTSPGYVGQDGETIWLDPDLVDARSRRCLEIIRATPSLPTPEAALTLANEYRGKFALDFAYEDWSAPYRDSLHAGYLRVMEQAIRIDLDTGHFGRGTYLAERAAEVDPDAEAIQAALVRLYRVSGAHAAAAEQYGHYAKSMRDLGVEPAAFNDL